MKKVLPILLLFVFALTACTNNTSSQYAGKYSGIFTFIKDSKTKSGNVRITVNPVSADGIMLYGILPLNKVSEGKFEASSENAEYMTSILEAMVGANGYIDKTAEAVKNIHVVTEFANGELHMTVSYTVEILSSLTTEVRILEFTGTKIS